jgi:hypothetical protein
MSNDQDFSLSAWKNSDVPQLPLSFYCNLDRILMPSTFFFLNPVNFSLITATLSWSLLKKGSACIAPTLPDLVISSPLQELLPRSQFSYEPPHCSRVLDYKDLQLANVPCAIIGLLYLERMAQLFEFILNHPNEKIYITPSVSK